MKSLHLEDGEVEREEFLHKVLQWLESTRFEVFVIVLVLIDLILVIIEAVLDSLFEFGHDEHGENRLLSSAESSRCDLERAMKVAAICRAISLTILFLFAIELFIKFLVAPKTFVKHVGHIFDVVVVGGSIIFELTMHHSAGAVLIFFRSWRFVRVLHAIYEEACYIHKVMETEAHFEDALDALGKYKSYTQFRGIHDDWEAYCKIGADGLKGTPIKMVVSQQEEVAQKSRPWRPEDEIVITNVENEPVLTVPGTVEDPLGYSKDLRAPDSSPTELSVVPVV